MQGPVRKPLAQAVEGSCVREAPKSRSSSRTRRRGRRSTHRDAPGSCDEALPLRVRPAPDGGGFRAGHCPRSLNKVDAYKPPPFSERGRRCQAAKPGPRRRRTACRDCRAFARPIVLINVHDIQSNSAAGSEAVSGRSLLSRGDKYPVLHPRYPLPEPRGPFCCLLGCK